MYMFFSSSKPSSLFPTKDQILRFISLFTRNVICYVQLVFIAIPRSPPRHVTNVHNVHMSTIKWVKAINMNYCYTVSAYSNNLRHHVRF